MTLNPPSFIPPVLAVGTGSSPNGRQSLGTGLVTHRGILEANSLRANGYVWPQSGRGTEVGFQNVAPYGYLQVIDRDTTTWLDLNLTAKNIALNPQAGGKVTLPAGTAQQTFGYMSALGWSTPSINVWHESPVQVAYTATGVNTRIEYSCSLWNTTGGAGVLAGLGLDGTFQWPLGAFGASGTMSQTLSGVMYTTPPAGLRRVSLFIRCDAGAAYFLASTSATLWVTEQRA